MSVHSFLVRPSLKPQGQWGGTKVLWKWHEHGPVPKMPQTQVPRASSPGGITWSGPGASGARRRTFPQPEKNCLVRLHSCCTTEGLSRRSGKNGRLTNALRQVVGNQKKKIILVKLLEDFLCFMSLYISSLGKKIIGWRRIFTSWCEKRYATNSIISTNILYIYNINLLSKLTSKHY